MYHQISDWKGYILDISTIDTMQVGDHSIIMYIPRNLTLNIGDTVRFPAKVRTTKRVGFFHYPRFLLMR